MDALAALQAMMMRKTLETNDVTTIDTLIMDIIPDDDSIKKEDILSKFFLKYGSQYDSDSVRSKITSTLSKLVKKGKLIRVEHGVYSIPKLKRTYY